MAASSPTLPAFLLALLLLFARPTDADHASPDPSQSPSPFSGGPDSPLIQPIPVSSPPSSSSPFTSPSPDLSLKHPPSPASEPASTPSPTPASEPASTPSPTPASEPASTPSPTPANSDIQDEDLSDLKPAEREIGGGDDGGGMSGGKKAAVSIGVVIGAGLVGLGAFVYKKRQENARRARYGYATRRDLL